MTTDFATVHSIFEEWAKLSPEQRECFDNLQEGFRHAVTSGQAQAVPAKRDRGRPAGSRNRKPKKQEEPAGQEV